MEKSKSGRKWPKSKGVSLTILTIFDHFLKTSKQKNIQFHIGKNPISITDEYTYLGLKLTPNTKFDIASQQLSEKAMHAMYKIRKQIDFHQLPPKLACKVFDSVISPILLYNSEVSVSETLQSGTKRGQKKPI